MNRQRGQILILCLFLAGAGAAALWFVFDAGQVVSARARIVTAADTAAWSAATWRARVLNFSAYTNRAIVAQEVAVAQAITLESWANYFENFTKTVKKLSRVYPPAYAFASAAAEAAEANRYLTEAAATAEILARDAPHVGYKTLLTQSQRVLQYTANVFALSAVAQEVAGTGDSRIKAYVLPDGTTPHDTFVHRYASDPERQRLRKVVERSLDRFTAGSRDANFLLPVPTGCVSDPFWHYRKRGGTKLAPGLDRWEAADTGSIHFARQRLFHHGCKSVEVYPMGWGGAEAGTTRLDDIVGNPGDAGLNKRALRNAESAMSDSSRVTHTGTGIARVFDLDYEHLANTRFPVSRVVVLARLAREKIRSATEINQHEGRLAAALQLPAGEMRAVGAAEVYFKRPPTDPARPEYASLYNPFWQVRLSAPTLAEREVARRVP